MVYLFTTIIHLFWNSLFFYNSLLGGARNMFSSGIFERGECFHYFSFGKIDLNIDN